MNTMNFSQQIFMVFFAILWGTSANAWPRWKMFHWTFFLRSSRIRRRVLWSVLVLNVIPVAYFACVLQRLGQVSTRGLDTPTILFGLIPAFAVFGLYRLWFSLVERVPKFFYYEDDNEMRSEKKDYLIGPEPTIEDLKSSKIYLKEARLRQEKYFLIRINLTYAAQKI